MVALARPEDQQRCAVGEFLGAIFRTFVESPSSFTMTSISCLVFPGKEPEMLVVDLLHRSCTQRSRLDLDSDRFTSTKSKEDYAINRLAHRCEMLIAPVRARPG